MKYAILGGSFDPVHCGHLKLANAALDAGYDRVIFVPAFQSPYKGEGQQMQAERRLEVLLAALGADSRWTVDACEIKREGVSYTIDTLRDIIVRYPSEARPALVLGDDLSADFLRWKDADKIAELADFVIARRKPGGPAFPYPHKMLDNEIWDVSSAEIRECFNLWPSWRGLVPEGAVRMIRSRKYYWQAQDVEWTPALLQVPADAPGFLSYMEDSVRGALDLYRYLHSRNVALHSSDLALRFGLDAKKAYLAGIAHDMARELRPSDMFSLAERDGLPFSQLELDEPFLLHGRAAAVMLVERFGVEDADVLEAVRFHTMGSPHLGALGKIVCLADKIEVGRPNVDPEFRRLAFGPDALCDLDALFNLVKKAADRHLKETLP
ncbi:MAG: nicotinate (nicotinamide) nucleotide adenylyltransferase [Spirochaetaceae bacterium]|jgi:nicotinate-nucleotide adenylyltransferase|nr:nicotinate (nicotinamide) nucleotide adenylyltransferase [Spirochaetaceae bacterium]